MSATQPYVNHWWWLILACSWHAAVLGQVPTHSFARDGIRRLESHHLTLLTDLPPDPTIDDLPNVFDAAIPQWCKYFGCEPAALDDWHVVGCLIRDRQRFRAAGLLPSSLPNFLNGYQRDDQIWVYEQPSSYYRRHLMLHEGVHAVMYRLFRHSGPNWYREGMAEYLGTHEWDGGRLSLAHFPDSRDEVEHWGRIKIIRDEIAAGKAKSIRDVISLPGDDFLAVEAYAWSWALTSFCHQHPLTRAAFRDLTSQLDRSSAAVTVAFLQAYERERVKIDGAWRLFLDQLDYGYDVAQDDVVYTDAIHDVSLHWTIIEVDTTKGWQSTGLRIPAGVTVEIQARGRYEVAQVPSPWLCEPQGVTIRYYRGRPLGQLLATVGETPGDPLAIGRGRQWSCVKGGTLFLRINERADGLRDNQGRITVRVRRAAPAD